MEQQQTMTERVAAFERYLETATDLQPSIRIRYAYEIRIFAYTVGNPSLNDLTPKVLLDWNAGLHDAGACRGTIVQKPCALKCLLHYLEDFDDDDEHAARLLRTLDRLQVPDDQEPDKEAYALQPEQAVRLLGASLDELSTISGQSSRAAWGQEPEADQDGTPEHENAWNS